MSCQTNHPKTEARLMRWKCIFDPYENVRESLSKPNEASRFTQVSQNFAVVDINKFDFGHFSGDAISKAGTKIILKLGQLSILKGLRFFGFSCDL